MNPEKATSNKTILILAVLVAIAAILYFTQMPGDSGSANLDQAADPETSQVSAEATENFSDDTDTTALESDLNASIAEFGQ